ncbi:MAG: phage integrase N-terminal SAM-like domain-containing protein [Methylotenera sp.]
MKRYIWHHGKRHPKDMDAIEIEAFLTHLAVVRNVSASTQNQAKSALFYLYKEVLGVDLPWLENVTQAKAPKRLPVVLTQAEVRTVLSRDDCIHAGIDGHKQRSYKASGNTRLFAGFSLDDMGHAMCCAADFAIAKSTQAADPGRHP